MTKRRRAQIRAFVVLVTPAITAYCTWLTDAASMEGAIASGLLGTLAAIGALVEQSPITRKQSQGEAR